MIAILSLVLFLAVLSFGNTLSVPVQEKPGTIQHKITLMAQGRFETSFTRQMGFGQTFYDLKNDPSKLLDLAPKLPAGAYFSGLFWVKIGRWNYTNSGASWEPNVPDSMSVLEASSARTRIRLKGKHTRFGTGSSFWDNLLFEQIYTFYPNGNVYIAYTIEAIREDTLSRGMAVITRSTGRWSPEGDGAKEVHPLSEYGAASPKPKTFAWHTQWSNGPTYFTDILMVTQKGKYTNEYWNYGFVSDNYTIAQDYRTAFAVPGLPGSQGAWVPADANNYYGGQIVPPGKYPLYFLMRFADNMNDTAAGNLISNDYRTPDALTITNGQTVKSDIGDADLDGYNEGEGCYVLNAGTNGAAFTLHGAATKRVDPAFKIKNWTWAVPGAIALGGSSLTRGTDFNAAYSGGVLILQILRTVTTDASVNVTGNGTPPALKTSLIFRRANTPVNDARFFDISGRRISLQHLFPGASSQIAINGGWIEERGKRISFSRSGE